MKFYEHRMEKIKAVFNWSGGKDSAHALWRARQSELYDIVALLTTINRDSQRSTMHGIPLPLLQAQADSIGIPLHIVNLTPQGNLENYAEAMTCAALHFKEQGVTHFIFGDIYLHDVRAYRERQLAPLGIEVVEPLWGSSLLGNRHAAIPRFRTEDGHRDHASRWLGNGCHRSRGRCRLYCLSPQGNGPQRRKRRIPHVLLRRTDILFTRTFPTGNSL